MLPYQIVTILCFSLLTATLLYVILKFALAKNKANRVAFLRSFKKGKCIAIYLICIPLFYAGIVYSSSHSLGNFFSAITSSAELVVLKYKTSPVIGLMTDYWFYSFTIYYAFVLVTLNALLFVLSIIGQGIWASLRMLSFHFSKKERIFIVGYSKESIALYESIKKSNLNCKAVIIDKLNKEAEETLYVNKIRYLSISYSDKVFDKIKKCIKSNQSDIRIIVNYLDGVRDLQLCQSYIAYINSLDEEHQEELFKHTRLYVYGDSKIQSIYDDFVTNGKGTIEYVNKYRMIAVDFVDKYPLTQFMDDKQIDYETSTIKDDVNINMLLIGFGHVNQQLFLTSVANNQFIDKNQHVKPVNYYIFDKVNSKNNKNLNHSYYRYGNEVDKSKQDDYLPLVDLPANEVYKVLDINDCEFYNEIRDKVSRDIKDINYIVVAFGSDLENIDLAKKLLEKKQEWGISNAQIFIRTRQNHPYHGLSKENNCYFFGNTNEVVYNVDNVFEDSLFKMAFLRNEIYDLEYEIVSNKMTSVSSEFAAECKENSDIRWYKSKTQFERESNIYCCLSLRMKLQLMGLDYCSIDEDKEEISSEEYLKIYAKEDIPDTSHYEATVNGKPITYYSLDFKESRRKNMSIIEHYRWNAFMISIGFIPSTREQILNEKNGKKFTNGKNYLLRRHGNITSFDGLIEFRQIVAKRDDVNESDKDVIKYDYQLLDDAYWLLKASNYKIIKK